MSFSLESSFSTQNPCINSEHNKLKYLDSIFAAYITAFLCYVVSCPRLIKDVVFWKMILYLFQKSYLKTPWITITLYWEAPCRCCTDFGAKNVSSLLLHLDVPICPTMKSIFTVFLPYFYYCLDCQENQELNAELTCNKYFIPRSWFSLSLSWPCTKFNVSKALAVKQTNRNH